MSGFSIKSKVSGENDLLFPKKYGKIKEFGTRFHA